jgi:hypothetical protein
MPLTVETNEKQYENRNLLRNNRGCAPRSGCVQQNVTTYDTKAFKMNANSLKSVHSFTCKWHNFKHLAWVWKVVSSVEKQVALSIGYYWKESSC